MSRVLGRVRLLQRLRAVESVDLTLMPGRTLGIVGESGSGKTMLSRAILGLLPRHARLDGRVRFDGADLTRLEPGALRRLRGRSLAVVFQDPMTSLNPVLTIGLQIMETLREHLGMTGATARKRAAELLAAVGIAEPEQRLRQYPHQLSGGMCQRAVIAMALSCEPKLLIADEPTTALDVTIQAQILELLDRLQHELGMAVLLITHDLGVVAGHADRVVVMYAGRVVETATTEALFEHPTHPYTEGLLAAVPRIDAPRARLHAIPGQVPAATAWPPGCRFHPRCPYAWEKCVAQEPPLLETRNEAGHTARCWLVTEPERRAPKR